MDLGSELFGSVFCLNRNQHQFGLYLMHMTGVQDRKETHSGQLQLRIRDRQSSSTGLQRSQKIKMLLFFFSYSL